MPDPRTPSLPPIPDGELHAFRAERFRAYAEPHVAELERAHSTALLEPDTALVDDPMLAGDAGLGGSPAPYAGSAAADDGPSPDENSALARVYQDALDAGHDEEGARAAVAVARTERGYGGAVGDTDRGLGSGGTFQLFGPGGQLDNFAAAHGMTLQDALAHLSANPHAANRWALSGYLGEAIKQGRARGLSGADLATYAQTNGQRSETPQRAGENYAALFGGSAPVVSAPAAGAGASDQQEDFASYAGRDLDAMGVTPDVELAPMETPAPASAERPVESFADYAGRDLAGMGGFSIENEQEQQRQAAAPVAVPSAPPPVEPTAVEPAAMGDELTRLAQTQQGPTVTPRPFLGGLLEGTRSLLGRPAQVARAGLPMPQEPPEAALAHANERLTEGGPFVAPVAPTPDLTPGQRIAEAYRRSEAEHPERSTAEHLGAALDEQNAALDETKRIGAGLDTATGGVVAGLANTVATQGTDPLVTVAPVVGRASAIGSSVGATAGAVQGLASSAGPQQVAEGVESGAQLGAVLGAPTAGTARGVARAVKGEGGHLIEDIVTAAPKPDPEVLAKGAQAGKSESWLKSYWYFALLSDPLTHARNIAGNVTMGAASAAVRPLAVAADQALSVLPGRSRSLSWNEVPAEAVGAWVGLRVGWQNAAKAFGNPDVAHTVGAKLELRDFRPPGADSANPLVRGAGAVVSFPTRALEAVDQFFRGVNAQSVLYGQAARRVAQMPEYRGRPLTDPEVWAKIEDLAANPTPGLAATVGKITAERVFQDNPDAFAKKVLELRQTLGPVGTVALPFFATPYNVWKAALRHTIGTDPSRFSKLKDPVEQAETLGRLGLAVGVGTVAWNLAGDDRLTGHAPPGVDRALWLQDHAEYSVKMGDKWVAVKDVAGPFAPLVMGMADAATAMRYARKPDKAAIEGVGGFLGGFLKLPFVPEVLTDTADLAQAGRTGNFASAAEQFVRTVTRPLESMAAPGIARFGERVAEQVTGEPYQRETRRDPVGGAVDRVKANLPGLADDLPARYDLFGEPVERQAGELSPIGLREKPGDPLVTELTRLRTTRDDEGEPLGKSVAPFPRSVQRGGKTVELDAETYSALARDGGQARKAALAKLTETKTYEDADDVERVKLLASVDRQVKKMATDDALARKAGGKARSADELRAEAETYVDAVLWHREFDQAPKYKAMSAEQGRAVDKLFTQVERFVRDERPTLKGRPRAEQVATFERVKKAAGQAPDLDTVKRAVRVANQGKDALDPARDKLKKGPGYAAWRKFHGDD